MKWLRLIPFLLSLVLTVVAVVLPNTVIRSMRMEWGWFNGWMGWAESLPPPVNAVHLVLFFLLGMAARLAAPRVRPWPMLISMGVIASLSEFVQLWVPGRTASWIDLVQDVLGAVAGVALVMGLQSLWKALRPAP